jgi:hypothetical protein
MFGFVCSVSLHTDAYVRVCTHTYTHISIHCSCVQFCPEDGGIEVVGPRLAITSKNKTLLQL